jgi:hypothetical protein
MEKLTAEEEEVQRQKDEFLNNERSPSSHRKRQNGAATKREESYEDLAELTDHDLSISDQQPSIHKYKNVSPAPRESPKRASVLPSLIRNSG